MLCLRHQITCQQQRITLRTDEYRLGGARQELDGAIRRNQALGRGYIPVARTNDLAYARNAFGSIGKRSDCLRSANAVELAHAQKCGRRQCCLGRSRRDHANMRHARYLRRNHRHQNSGRQGIAAAGNIAAHRFQWPHQLSHANSRLNFPSPFFRPLPLAVRSNVCCRQRNGFSQVDRRSLPRLLQIGCGHAQRLGFSQAIPTRRVASQSAVAIPSNVFHNAPHCRLNLTQIRRSPHFQRMEEPGSLRPFKNAHHITTLFNGYSTIP